MTRLVCAIVLFSIAALAQDLPLAALKATLVPLRERQNEHRETRGATPELTHAKRQLRDWIEARLARFPALGDQDALTGEIHDALRNAGLFCDDCPLSALGYLDEVRVAREREFLIVQTSAGIWCGYDDSAYVYRWTGDRWQRLWEGEQDVYTPKGYLPQSIHAVRLSPADRAGNRLLLTLGSKPGCSAAFEPVYYRLWRLGWSSPKLLPKLLLDRAELANVGEFPPVQGRVESNEVTIEFNAGGTSYGFPHKAVRHFEVRGSQVRQIGPLAPTPRDFVEEWLSAPWRRSAVFSESPDLRSWHRKLHRGDGMGDFPDPTLPCAGSPELWQVGIRLHDVAGKTYYLVRWKQPFEFKMVSIGEQPFGDCAGRDRR